MASPLDTMAKTVGKAFGRIFYDAVLTREIPGTSTDPADPVPPSTIPYPCKALAVNYSTGLVMNGLVASTDTNVLILASTLDVEPQPLDKILIARQRINGTIVPKDTAGLQAVIGDPAQATWQCRVLK